jgi:flagellar assembly protein FliH
VQADESSPFGWVEQQAESFDYVESPDAPFVPSWTEWDDAPDVAVPAGAGQPDRGKALHAEKPSVPEFERRLAEETRRSFEAGRARGTEEGRRLERQAREQAGVAEGQEKIRQAAALVENFAAERQHYFQSAELELVRLAVAVAARILRREAASDPLLLMGAVRAALGQVSGSTEVRLRVPAAELDLWMEAIALLPNLATKPTVLPGEGMMLGDCRIETALGTADLGVRAQLAEVERGLLGGAARPSAPAAFQPESDLATAAAESAA